MKRIFLIFTVILLLSALCVNVGAECASRGWYIKKKKVGTPDFPPDEGVISELGGLYLDKKANYENNKRVYLTFDAGYENGNIEKILDIMKEEDVKSAFFILSNLIRKNTELVKRMAKEGHLVCNHTSNHKDLTKLSNDEIKENLQTLEALYKENTGYEMAKFFRFPEGKYSVDALKCVNGLGYKSVFWSIAYADWDEKKQPSEEYAINKLLSQIHPGAIILLHPTSSTNAKVLKRFIRDLKEQGYSFGLLDEIN